MGERLRIFKCENCGNMVEVLYPGGGELSCCGMRMKLCDENTVDASYEKHDPVVEAVEGGYIVRVGEAEHPMDESHYIQWIELISGDKMCIRFLRPGEKPEAFFRITDGDSGASGNVVAREYCNFHGLWKRQTG